MPPAGTETRRQMKASAQGFVFFKSHDFETTLLIFESVGLVILSVTVAVVKTEEIAYFSIILS